MPAGNGALDFAVGDGLVRVLCPADRVGLHCLHVLQRLYYLNECLPSFVAYHKHSNSCCILANKAEAVHVIRLDIRSLPSDDLSCVTADCAYSDAINKIGACILRKSAYNFSLSLRDSGDELKG